MSHEGEEIGAEADVVATVEPGADVSLYEHGCPVELPAKFVCSYAAHLSPEHEALELRVEVDGVSTRRSVDLEPERCGRRIAYLEVRRQRDGKLHVSSARYISPCSVLAD